MKLDIIFRKIRVYARKNAVVNGLIDYAVNVAKNGLDFFENVYFDSSAAVPPKIGNQKNQNLYEIYSKIELFFLISDLIAVPDFSSGAMEHWVHIIYVW